MPPDLSLTLSILVFAYFVRGLTGFGSGLVSVPLLAHYLPLTLIVPLVLALDYVAALALGGRLRREVAWSELRLLLPFSAVGTALALSVLLALPRQPLLAGLGLFVGAIGLRSLAGRQGEARIARWWAIPAGLAGGAVQVLFGTGGPLYVIYLTHRLGTQGPLRATYSGFFAFDGGLRLAMFLFAGMLTQDGLPARFGAGLPAMAAGLYLGHRVLRGISARRTTQLVALLLVASGASLIHRALV